MSQVFRDYTTRCFEEWRDCIHKRARVVAMIRSLPPGGAGPGLVSLLSYYNRQSQRMWRRFRLAYTMTLLPRGVCALSG